MDKASDFESEDCEFESRRGRCFETRFPHKIKRKDVPFWAELGKRSNVQTKFHPLKVCHHLILHFPKFKLNSILLKFVTI